MYQKIAIQHTTKSDEKTLHLAEQCCSDPHREEVVHDAGQRLVVGQLGDPENIHTPLVYVPQCLGSVHIGQ